MMTKLNLHNQYNTKGTPPAYIHVYHTTIKKKLSITCRPLRKALHIFIESKMKISQRNSTAHKT